MAWWPFRKKTTALAALPPATIEVHAEAVGPQKGQSAPDVTPGVQPTTRTYTAWDPYKIRAAEIAADAGYLWPAANLCDWLLGDDRIGGLLHTRVQSLLGLEPTFEKTGDKRRSSRAVRALDAQEDWWAAYPESELALMLTWGILLGLAPLRHNPVRDAQHGNRFLPMPQFWHPQHVRKDAPTETWQVRVAQSPGVAIAWTEETLTPGDGTWILHTPYGPHRPWSMGLWRGLARWALLKSYAIGDWSKHGQKGALLVGTSPQQSGSGKEQWLSTAPQRQQLARDIEQRGREAVAILPAGFDLKLVESVANTKQLYEAQIRMADEAAAIAIRGGNLTTQVTSGSLAAAETQERLGDDAKRRFDAQSLTTTIHDQSLAWWSAWNFGDPSLAPWPVYPVKQATDLTKKAQSLGFAADAALKWRGLGYDVDRAAFAEEFEAQDFFIPTEGEPPPPPPATEQPPKQTPPPSSE